MVGNEDNYIKKLMNQPVWSYRPNDGRGDEIFVDREQAQEALKQGHFVLKRCKVGDLR